MQVPERFPDFEALSFLAQQYPELEISSIEPFIALLKLSSRLESEVEAYLQKLGFSHGRFMVMMLLLRHPERPLHPAEMATVLGVTRSTMTGLLDTLESKAWIERVAVPSDKRCCAVVLTAEGRAQLDGILPGHYKRMSQAMGSIDEDERKTLIKLLGKVSQGLQIFIDYQAEAAEPPIPSHH